MMRFALGVLIFLQALVLALSGLANSSARQQSDQSPYFSLNELASATAQVIEQDSKDSRVLVLDFSEKMPTQVGLRFAEGISALLGGMAQKFTVISRSDLPQLFDRDRIPATELKNHEALSCYGRELGADLIVEGDIDASSDRVQLYSDVRRLRDLKKLADESASVPVTPEIKAMLMTPRTFSAISLDEYRTRIGIPQANQGGYSNAKCATCPPPSFPDPAIKSRADAVLEVAVEWDVDGEATKSTILQGAPCGFNQRALKAIEDWRVTPADGPDGKRAAVWTPVEMTFRLFF